MMLKIKKAAIMATLLAGVVSMGTFNDVSAAPGVSVTSTTMINCTINDLRDDIRVFKVDKTIQNPVRQAQ